MDWIRTKMVIGQEALQKIQNKKVIIFGIGGVGGAAVEALCRMGIKDITFIDHDIVDASNINRQFIATSKTIGEKKVDVMKKRLEEIYPEGNFKGLWENVNAQWLEGTSLSYYDGVLDCIDTVSAKIALYDKAKKEKVYLLSAMGTGNKLDPSQLVHTTLEKTKNDPLARVLRRECKKRNIKNIEVVYSKELPTFWKQKKTSTPGSTPFVPPAAGLFMASILCRKWLDEEDV